MSDVTPQNFILTFDHHERSLTDIRRFGTDADAAAAAYREMTDAYENDPDIEIALVTSESMETVRFTHANYFDGRLSVTKRLQHLERWLDRLTVNAQQSVFA